MSRPEFEGFPKIARFFRDIVISEKIDGTNALVHVSEDGEVFAGSRTRWIDPANDNAGFAKWVKANEYELRNGLGFGTHWGEWWGQGIGRNYGLKEKRFSLFNVERWSDDTIRPACCGVVPTLYKGPISSYEIDRVVYQLRASGSVAAPGFMRPEGIIVFHTAGHQMFKVTCEHDEKPKSI